MYRCGLGWDTMARMTQTIEVDPHDDRALRAWYDALYAGATADRTAPTMTTYAAMAYSLRNPGPSRRRLAVAAVDGDQTAGALLFELPLKEDLSTVAVEIDVPPAHRGCGVGSDLWAWAAERADREGRTVFRSEVNVPAGHDADTWPGMRFATRLGFSSENVENHLVRGLPVGGSALVDLDAAVVDAAGYRIVSWLGASPPELVDAYAGMLTGMSRDVPTGGMTRDVMVWDSARVRVNEARMHVGYLILVSLALTGHGDPAGYTLAFVPRDEPDHVIQDDTYVLLAHRATGWARCSRWPTLASCERTRRTPAGCTRGPRRRTSRCTASTRGSASASSRSCTSSS